MVCTGKGPAEQVTGRLVEYGIFLLLFMPVQGLLQLIRSYFQDIITFGEELDENFSSEVFSLQRQVWCLGPEFTSLRKH